MPLCSSGRKSVVLFSVIWLEGRIPGSKACPDMRSHPWLFEVDPDVLLHCNTVIVVLYVEQNSLFVLL